MMLMVKKMLKWHIDPGRVVRPLLHYPTEQSLVTQTVKNLPAMWETWVRSLEKETATHASILAWRIPWTEEPGGLQSMQSQRVRHN